MKTEIVDQLKLLQGKRSLPNHLGKFIFIDSCLVFIQCLFCLCIVNFERLDFRFFSFFFLFCLALRTTWRRSLSKYLLIFCHLHGSPLADKILVFSPFFILFFILLVSLLSEFHFSRLWIAECSSDI